MKIHFIGIGGIGVSALAKYYLAKGYEVSGCDLVASEITDQLKKEGAKIRIGKPQTICSKNSDLVVYSPAVKKPNPELKGRKSLSYPEALGELTKTHYTIAVSGTHGKSTTTAMLGLLLIKAGLDPTVIVGTKLKEFNDSNCRVGKSKYLVIEADEHFASFLNYWPQIITLTNIAADHLDYYKNVGNIIKTFKKYLSHLPQKGWIIANSDDPNSANLTAFKNTVWYSNNQKEAATLRKLLKIPGEHIVADALAALATARVLKIPDKISFKALSEYNGAWRRFEIFHIKKPKPYTLVSDYGHNPTKARVTVEGARQKWPKKKIWLVYQPHQYSRTYYLWDDFVETFSRLPVNKLIITDIYDVAGREETKIKQKVSSEKLVKAIVNCKLKIENYPVLYISTLQQVEQYLQKNLRGGEVVMVMGAGNIYGLTVRLTKKHPKRKIKA